MTSLNPVLTIGRQITEALELHLKMDRRGANKRAAELLEMVGIPAAATPPQRLSAPVLRRHAPARHDRHGALLQPEAPPRRRADHRARRHHPGADPRDHGAPQPRARHRRHHHHPQPRRGRPLRRPRQRHVRGQDRRDGDRARALRQPAPPLHARPAAVGAAARPGRDGTSSCPSRACRRTSSNMPAGCSLLPALRVPHRPAARPRSRRSCWSATSTTPPAGSTPTIDANADGR